MLNINIFEDFISVGAKDGISKYASAIMPEDGFQNGMSGYDVEQFIKHVMGNNQEFSDILKHFSFDSEYSMFCMYYKHEPKGLATKKIINDEDVKKCTELVSIINNLIRNEYLDVVSNLDTNVGIYDCRKS